MRLSVIALTLMSVVALPSVGQTTGTATQQKQADPKAQKVGTFAEVFNQVRQTPPGGTTMPAQVLDDVVERLQVETGARSSTRMAMGVANSSRGTILLGEATRFRVERWAIDQSTGQVRSRLRLDLGRLRAALTRLFQGDVIIHGPSTTIEASGTMIDVGVDAKLDTEIQVIEGKADVTSFSESGEVLGRVTVRAGEWTRVAYGAPPTLPVRLDPTSGILGPPADAGFEIPQPPLPEPPRPPLDLPKLRHPP